ncbi:MAG: hypothetical protein JKX98_04380 [Alcanivoracaceae bacterium]|nr:hypothetical protein [Alcanivoracaceae bacterium]
MTLTFKVTATEYNNAPLPQFKPYCHPLAIVIVISTMQYGTMRQYFLDTELIASNAVHDSSVSACTLQRMGECIKDIYVKTDIIKAE